MDKENLEKDYIPEQLEDEDFEKEKAELKKKKEEEKFQKKLQKKERKLQKKLDKEKDSDEDNPKLKNIHKERKQEQDKIATISFSGVSSPVSYCLVFY